MVRHKHVTEAFGCSQGIRSGDGGPVLAPVLMNESPLLVCHFQSLEYKYRLLTTDSPANTTLVP